MRIFLIVCFGEFISLLGTRLSWFALGVWAYQQTNSVTQYALISFFIGMPVIVISPIAGVYADRYNRKKMMILSSCGAALATLFIAILLSLDLLEIWHIYVLVAIGSSFDTLRWAGYHASIILLVPKKHLGRASGLVRSSNAGAFIISPPLAALLLELIHLKGVILLDFISFAFGVIVLLLIRFPLPKSQKMSTKKSIWKEMTIGWKYIAKSPGLIGLIWYYTIYNAFIILVMMLLQPLVLASASVSDLANIISMSGLGMLFGGLVMSIWGGPKHRIYGMLGLAVLHGICMIFIGLLPYVHLGAIVFCFYFCLSISGGTYQALWLCKVAPEIQGRVFSIRRAIVTSFGSIGHLLSGPLADYVFEPLMKANGALAKNVGLIIGVGPGRGIALLFVLMGISTILITIVGFLYPRLRLLEKEVPNAID